MNKETVEGELRQGIGAAEKAFGRASGDVEMSVHGKVQEVIGQVQSTYGQVKDQAAETFGGVDAFVSERPYLSVGIAVAVGAALGFIMGVGRPKVIVIKPVPPRA